MYVYPNFKTKKELREAVFKGRIVRVVSSGSVPCKQNGIEYIEGPHHPEPHRWHAEVEVEDGIVTKVRG